MHDLSGHVALVTGGNSGIGLGMAEGLVSAGADIAIWGTNAEKNEKAVTRLLDHGVRVHSEVCNISDPNQVTAAFDRTVTLLGKVDSVFTSAGIGGPVRPFTDLTLAEWNQVFGINLSGTFLTLQAGARHLVERGEGGALIAVSSTAAIHGAPRHEAYAASKTAILGLTRSLAVGLAQSRIRVNALLPGWTDTGMLDYARSWKTFVNNTTSRTPAGRWADPTEYGRVAVFLADPSLTFHTGDTVVVDGGYTVF